MGPEYSVLPSASLWPCDSMGKHLLLPMPDSLLAGFLQDEILADGWSWCWKTDILVAAVCCSLQMRGTGKRTWIPLASITAFVIQISPHPFSPLASFMNTSFLYLLLVLSSSSLLLHTLKNFNTFVVIVGGFEFGLTAGQARFLTRWDNEGKGRFF